MKTIYLGLCLVGTSLSVHAADFKALSKVSTLTAEAAQVAAHAALKDCQKRGAVVAVAVVDRSGVPLVILRDALSGMHTPETATRKAWTAVSFKSSTVDMEKTTAYNQASSGIRHLPGVVMIGGGLPIQAAGSLVGGIGVSGAPGGEMDDECAKAGIKAIRDALDLD
ncbi:MAG: heme-binding protein [Burkholderiales bacterium]